MCTCNSFNEVVVVEPTVELAEELAVALLLAEALQCVLLYSFVAFLAVANTSLDGSYFVHCSEFPNLIVNIL